MSVSKKQPTVQDVADRAGVSTATVSRALRSPDSVSEEKRYAVEAAVRLTGYRVNRAARNLRTQQSNSVLALLPDLGNPFFSQVLQGIENVLTPAGFALVVAETKQIQDAGDDLIHYLEDQRADGVIVLDGGLSSKSIDALIRSHEEQRVLFACEWIPGTQFPSIRSANVDGAIQAVRYLYAKGHRVIAHVMGPEGNVLTDERLHGFLQAANELKLSYSLIEGDFNLQAGVKAARDLITLTPTPTAVFCASDTIAFGLISALNKAGLNIPEDISVVGFDDIEFAEHFIPALTSIRQDRIVLGGEAARMLLHCIKHGEQPNRVERIPVALIERASCSEITG